MKFTTPIAMIDPSFYIPLAQAAEELGFDSIAVPDSIAYPQAVVVEVSRTTPTARVSSSRTSRSSSRMTAIAAMGVATERIEFHTFVLKMPMRHPVMLAKEATSVAVLTDNRFVLGVGTSPWPDDYEIVGLPWERRGRRFDECIDIVSGLSAGGYFGYEGEFYDFPPIKLNPIPTRPIPILIGGHSDANLRRAARRCDGWMAAGGSPDDLTGWITRIHELRREYGRDQRAVRHLRHELRLVQPRRHQATRRPRRHAHLRRVRALQPVRRGGRSRDAPGEDRQPAPLRRRRDRQSEAVMAADLSAVDVASTYLDALGHPGRRPRAPRARRPPPAQRPGDGGRRRRDPGHPPAGAAGGDG